MIDPPFRTEFSSSMETVFRSFPKIDAHLHLNSRRGTLLQVALGMNFRVVCMVIEAGFFPSLATQQEIIQEFRRLHPGKISFLAGFTMNGWADSGPWLSKTMETIHHQLEQGAVGVKIWKNVGMEILKADGSFLMIDDPALDLFFAILDRERIPLEGHIGEPRNGWLPLEQMTNRRNRRYFEAHPEHHAYLHPELPHHTDFNRATDQMLTRHPHLTYVGAHLASLEWTLEGIRDFLVRHPNAFVDLSSRMLHLQGHAINQRMEVMTLFHDFQDRIIYGSDLIEYDHLDPSEFEEKARTTYLQEWLFLAADQWMAVADLDGEFQGLNLPTAILKKVYCENAMKAFPELTKQFPDLNENQ